jgi:hypothetical protein
VSVRPEEAGSPALSARREPIDAVVTHHRDGFRSGVARFNELLAEGLGVPCIWLFDSRLASQRCPLLSFKVGEMHRDERERLSAILDAQTWRGEVFLHEYAGDPLERRLIERAQRIHCGNHEIFERLRGEGLLLQTTWSPGLILDDRRYRPTEISVFSFGMAHKLRTDMFERLRELLDASRRSYALYVSAANHETTKMQDAQLIFRELHEIFPDDRLYFLGNLSDVAVYNWLCQATFFAAFFVGGVRANNGSVAAAMEKGAVVVTNLDEHSPPEFAHMDNVIDIELCEELPSDPLVLKRLSVRAIETARERSWGHLVRALQD